MTPRGLQSKKTNASVVSSGRKKTATCLNDFVLRLSEFSLQHLTVYEYMIYLIQMMYHDVMMYLLILYNTVILCHSIIFYTYTYGTFGTHELVILSDSLW